MEDQDWPQIITPSEWKRHDRPAPWEVDDDLQALQDAMFATPSTETVSRREACRRGYMYKIQPWQTEMEVPRGDFKVTADTVEQADAWLSALHAAGWETVRDCEHDWRSCIITIRVAASR